MELFTTVTKNVVFRNALITHQSFIRHDLKLDVDIKFCRTKETVGGKRSVQNVISLTIGAIT